MVMSSCIGWLFDISIEHDQAIIWIKTADRQILKLADPYSPGIYVLPRSETDGLYLFQILSRQQDIVEQAKVIGNDFYSDIAVLKIETNSSRNDAFPLKTLPMYSPIIEYLAQAFFIFLLMQL